jgi:hypothetical protein
MRTTLLSVFISWVFSTLSAAAPAPTGRTLIERTSEELSAAKAAYAKAGMKYEAMIDQSTTVVLHTFVSSAMTDADLKKLSDLPFSFALELNCSEVTDGGLKELKGLSNLVALNLSDTRVTDFGRKQRGRSSFQDRIKRAASPLFPPPLFSLRIARISKVLLLVIPEC